MKNIQPKICRLCLNQDLDDFELIDSDRTDMIGIILPDLKIDIFDDCIICNQCSASLSKAFAFKTSCLEIEDNIHNYTDNGQVQVNLEKILGLTDMDDTFEDDDELMNRKNMRICRTCLDMVELDTFTRLDSYENHLVKQILQQCLPELDCHLTQDPGICDKCKHLAGYTTEFISQCTDLEAKIMDYVKSELPENLNIYNAYKYLFHDKESDPDVTILTQENEEIIVIEDDPIENRMKVDSVKEMMSTNNPDPIHITKVTNTCIENTFPENKYEFDDNTDTRKRKCYSQNSSSISGKIMTRNKNFNLPQVVKCEPKINISGGSIKSSRYPRRSSRITTRIMDYKGDDDDTNDPDFRPEHCHTSESDWSETDETISFDLNSRCRKSKPKSKKHKKNSIEKNIVNNTYYLVVQNGNEVGQPQPMCQLLSDPSLTSVGNNPPNCSGSPLQGISSSTRSQAVPSIGTPLAVQKPSLHQIAPKVSVPHYSVSGTSPRILSMPESYAGSGMNVAFQGNMAISPITALQQSSYLTYNQGGAFIAGPTNVPSTSQTRTYDPNMISIIRDAQPHTFSLTPAQLTSSINRSYAVAVGNNNTLFAQQTNQVIHSTSITNNGIGILSPGILAPQTANYVAMNQTGMYCLAPVPSSQATWINTNITRSTLVANSGTLFQQIPLLTAPPFLIDNASAAKQTPIITEIDPDTSITSLTTECNPGILINDKESVAVTVTAHQTSSISDVYPVTSITSSITEVNSVAPIITVGESGASTVTSQRISSIYDVNPVTPITSSITECNPIAPITTAGDESGALIVTAQQTSSISDVYPVTSITSAITEVNSVAPIITVGESGASTVTSQQISSIYDVNPVTPITSSITEGNPIAPITTAGDESGALIVTAQQTSSISDVYPVTSITSAITEVNSVAPIITVGESGASTVTSQQISSIYDVDPVTAITSSITEGNPIAPITTAGDESGALIVTAQQTSSISDVNPITSITPPITEVNPITPIITGGKYVTSTVTTQDTLLITEGNSVTSTTEVNAVTTITGVESEAVTVTTQQISSIPDTNTLITSSITEGNPPITRDESGVVRAVTQQTSSSITDVNSLTEISSSIDEVNPFTLITSGEFGAQQSSSVNDVGVVTSISEIAAQENSSITDQSTSVTNIHAKELPYMTSTQPSSSIVLVADSSSITGNDRGSTVQQTAPITVLNQLPQISGNDSGATVQQLAPITALNQVPQITGNRLETSTAPEASGIISTLITGNTRASLTNESVQQPLSVTEDGHSRSIIGTTGMNSQTSQYTISITGNESTALTVSSPLLQQTSTAMRVPEVTMANSNSPGAKTVFDNGSFLRMALLKDFIPRKKSTIGTHKRNILLKTKKRSVVSPINKITSRLFMPPVVDITSDSTDDDPSNTRMKKYYCAYCTHNTFSKAKADIHYTICNSRTKSKPNYKCLNCGHKNSNQILYNEHKKKCGKTRVQKKKKSIPMEIIDLDPEISPSEQTLHEQSAISDPVSNKTNSNVLLSTVPSKKQKENEVAPSKPRNKDKLSDSMLRSDQKMLAVLKCDSCSFNARTYAKMEQHLEVHISELRKDDVYQCDQCDSCFLNSEDMSKHLKYTHSLDHYKIFYWCVKCATVFNETSELREHSSKCLFKDKVVRLFKSNDSIFCLMCEFETNILNEARVHLKYCRSRNIVVSDEVIEID